HGRQVIGCPVLTGRGSRHGLQPPPGMKMLARVWHTGIRPKPRRTSVQLTSTSATIPPTCYDAATRISSSTARLTVPPPEGGEPYFQSSLQVYPAERGSPDPDNVRL